MGQAAGSAVGGLGNKPAQYAAPFESSGGITPEQQSLADYTYGQNLLETQGQFGGNDAGGGAGMSTMATQAATGAQMGKALQEGQLSDTDQSAEYKAYQVANQVQDINNGAANQQLSSSIGGLGALANQANSGSGGYSAGVSSGGL